MQIPNVDTASHFHCSTSRREMFNCVFCSEPAKQEFQKRLDDQGLDGPAVSIDDAGKMTDLQIAAKVLQRFPLRSRVDLYSCRGSNTPSSCGGDFSLKVIDLLQFRRSPSHLPARL